jgi:hypothetical protein
VECSSDVVDVIDSLQDLQVVYEGLQVACTDRVLPL